MNINKESKIKYYKSKYNDLLDKAENGDIDGFRKYCEGIKDEINILHINWDRVYNIFDTSNNEIACLLTTTLNPLFLGSIIVNLKRFIY